MRRLALFLLVAVAQTACAADAASTPDDQVAGPSARKNPPPSQQTQGSPADVEASSQGGGGLPPAGAACQASKPFLAAVLVSGVDADDTGYGVARLSGDELRAYYSSPTGTLLKTARTSSTGTFAQSAPLLAVSKAWQPTLSQDERVLVFSRGDDHEQLYIATRGASDVPFGTPSLVGTTVNNASRAQIDPYLRGDGKELFFHRYNPGQGKEYGDIHVAAIVGGTVQPARILENVNSPTDDRWPVVTADGLTIYWASDRTDLGAKGNFDIYMARRASVTSPFTTVTNVAELNSSTAERPAWVSADGCRLYFQKGPSLLVAARPPL